MSRIHSVQVVHSTKTKSKLWIRLACHWQKTMHIHDIVHNVFTAPAAHTLTHISLLIFYTCWLHQQLNTETGSWLPPTPTSIVFLPHTFAHTMEFHCIIWYCVASNDSKFSPRHKQIKTEKRQLSWLCVCVYVWDKADQNQNANTQWHELRRTVAPVNQKTASNGIVLWRKCILMTFYFSTFCVSFRFSSTRIFRFGIRYYCADNKSQTLLSAKP